MKNYFSLKNAKKQNYTYLLVFPEYNLTLPCEIIFSDRKSISIQIKEDASVQVRAPYRALRKTLENFIEEKRSWIYTNHLKVKEHIK